MEEKKYFNFPISLLNGFLSNDRIVLDNIFDYALFSKTLEYETGTMLEKMKKAEKFFGVKSGNISNTYSNGQELYESIPHRTPKVGINKEIYFDYLKNEKDDFQKICLLSFLAIKSILQNKPYCKIDNKFWISRMDGKEKSENFFSKELRCYTNRYQLTKIKNTLEDWGLKHYGRYCRGFYVSFNLSYDELVYHAEKRRISTKEKARKEAEKLAIKRAYERINTTTS